MAPGRPRTGTERSLSEAACAGAFINALRHAGITASVSEVRIQREPFHARGAVADAFRSSRFQGRLRHVDVLFQTPVRGPLIVGNGRFVGLGVMRPVKETAPGLHVFSVEQSGAPVIASSAVVARALRRVVMARAQVLYGRNALPVFFHGHENDGSPSRAGNHAHLFVAAFSSDGGARIDRAAVMAPGLCDRSILDRKHWSELARAVDGLQMLHCGQGGALSLTFTHALCV